MHILFGAVVGALFAVAMTVGMSLVMGKKPNWKHVALAALGGAVAGAVASATLGAGSFAAAGIGRQVVGFGLGGAAGGASEQVGENVFDGRPLHEGVGRATVIGGATGVVSLGATHAGSALTSKVLPRVLPGVAARLSAGVDDVAAVTPSLLRRVMAASTPGTGGGFRRGLDAEFDNDRPPAVPDAEAPFEPALAPGDATTVAPAPAPLQVPAPAAAPARPRPTTPGFAGALGKAF